MFDKEKSCKDCPDRTVQPNCHETCKGYIKRCEIRKERNEKARQEAVYRQYEFNRKYRISKRCHHASCFTREKYRTI